VREPASAVNDQIIGKRWGSGLTSILGSMGTFGRFSSIRHQEAPGLTASPKHLASCSIQFHRGGPRKGMTWNQIEFQKLRMNEL
jgi:hypothetical protein